MSVPGMTEKQILKSNTKVLFYKIHCTVFGIIFEAITLGIMFANL